MGLLARCRTVLDEGTARGGRMSPVRGTYRGRRVWIKYSAVGWRTRFLRIVEASLACPVRQSFKVLAEGDLLARLLTVSLGRDQEVGEPALDALFTFRSADPQRLAAWVRLPDVARQLGELAAVEEGLRFRGVELRDGRLITTYTAPPRRFVSGEQVGRILEHLLPLAAAVEREWPVDASASWRLIRFWHGGGRVLTVLAVAAAGASLLLWYFFWRDAG